MWNIVKVDYHNLFTHALSGGYTYKNSIPLSLCKAFTRLDRNLPKWLRKHITMMLLVVLERK